MHADNTTDGFGETGDDSPTVILDADAPTRILDNVATDDLEEVFEPEPEPEPVLQDQHEVEEEPEPEPEPEPVEYGTTVLNFVGMDTAKAIENAELNSSTTILEPVVEDESVATENQEPEPEIVEEAEPAEEEVQQVEEMTSEEEVEQEEIAEPEKKKESILYLRQKGTGDVFKLTKDSSSVGKSKYSDIQIKDTKTVSRHHITVKKGDGCLYIEDNKSLNGTYLNNKKLDSGQSVEAKDGDVIRISDVELEVCSE